MRNYRVLGTNTDYMLSQTNKCKEPIYIETVAYANCLSSQVVHL